MKIPKIAGLIIAGAMFLAFIGSASAHEADEFDFTGKAIESCIDPGESWSIEWTIANDENANPFGIIDADTDDGVDADFEPLENDDAPGEFIPPGDEATATTTHAYAEASVTLTVEHDVTRDDNTFWDETVERPPLCAVDDASIEVRKNVLEIANDPTIFTIDISGVATDFTGVDETDPSGAHVKGDLTAGQYILTEVNVPAGYEYVSWACTSDQPNITFNPSNVNMSVTVSLRAGEDIACTVTNRPKPPTPTPTATSAPAATATAQPAATVAPTTKSIPCPDGTVEVVPINYLGAVCVGHSSAPLAPIVPVTQNVNVTAPQAAPPAPAAPAPIVPSSSNVIRAPNTGDGGLAAQELDPNAHPGAWAWLVVGALGALGVGALAMGVSGYINRRE